MGAYAHHARVLGYKNEDVDNFFYTALQAIANKNTVDELLPLLYQDIENIRLGPTLPAFVSPNVLNILVEKF